MDEFEKLSTKNAAAMAEAKTIDAGKKKKELREKISGAEEKKREKLETKSTKADAKDFKNLQAALASNTSGPAKSNENATAEAAEKERQSEIRKYEKYYNHPRLGEYCNINVKPNANWTLKEAKYHHANVVSKIGSHQAEKLVQDVFCGLNTGAEMVTMQYGLNPMNWDLTNLGAASREAVDQHVFDTELQEAAIELGDMFQQPWQIRLAAKWFNFMKTYSDSRKTVPQQVQDKYKDL